MANEEKCKAIIMLYGISALTSSWSGELMFVLSLLHELSSLSISSVIRVFKIQLLNATHNFNSNVSSFLRKPCMLQVQFPSYRGTDSYSSLNAVYLGTCTESRAQNICCGLCLKVLQNFLLEY